MRSFAGLSVIKTPSGGFLIRIISGMVGKGLPLYVIDDMPTQVDANRGIEWFTLQDIVRIRVLKDPAETTMYGPRGINGVILITTKQGMRTRNPAIPPMHRAAR